MTTTTHPVNEPAISPASESPDAWAADLDRWDSLPPEELLDEAHRTFGARAVIGTSFQHTGLVILHMAKVRAIPLRVFTVDTGRLPLETLEHIEAVEEHLDLRVERIAPDPADVARMVRQHGEFLFFDSCDKRQHCCRVRKDMPTGRYLAQMDCWITGLRRDQAEERQEVKRAALSHKYGHAILKLNPLVDWRQDEVIDYVRRHGLPENPLHRQGYSSLGCVICTTPIRPGEPTRAGRWRWEHQGETKECGLHLESGAGI